MAKRIQGRYVCCECGREFDEDDIKIVQESRGEFWGVPCYESVELSPCCDADFKDAYEDELIEE